MAKRRMFSPSVVLSDAFMDMPASARCLYFTLGMCADDDGFVNAPKSVMRQCGASQDDMMILIAKRYILAFDSGVVVIKHWRLNNYLRSDRYTSTTYLEEKATLTFDGKGAYIEKDEAEKRLLDSLGIPACVPDGIPLGDTGKVRLGKVSKRINNISVDSGESTLPEIDGDLTDDAKSEEPEKPKKKKAPLKLTVQQIEAFNEFYANFPRHTHRIDAEKAYAKALTRATVEAILAGAINYASWVKRNKVEQKYVTHPSTWLNAGAWDDELEDRAQTGRTNQPSGRITSNRRDDDYSTV